MTENEVTFSNNSNIFFQSKFNLTYLQSFKLLLPNFTIEEMVKLLYL